MSYDTKLSLNLCVFFFISLCLGFPFIGGYFIILILQLYEEILEELLLDIIFEGDVEDPDYAFTAFDFERWFYEFNEKEMDVSLYGSVYYSSLKKRLK